MRARARELAFGLGLASASLVLGLLAAEVVVRTIGFTPERFKSPARVMNREGTLALDCHPTNPRSYFRIDLRDPSTRARYEAEGVEDLERALGRAPYAVEYRYNSLGFRDRELGPKPPGVLRVLVLGDSFTEGQGVREEDAYPRVLERLLNLAEPGSWEVRNCGDRGADFPKLYESFEKLLAHDPDLVLYGMVLNDADQSPEFRARQRYLDDWILDRRRTAGTVEPRSRGPFRSRLAAFVAERIEAWRVGRETTRWYLEMYGEANRQGWERTQRYLRTMNRRMSRRGGRFLVASWPLLVGTDGGYPFAEPTAAIARACAEAGLGRVDLLQAFEGRPTESLWVSAVDRHPNEIAHRLAAEALVPAVRALFMQPAPAAP